MIFAGTIGLLALVLIAEWAAIHVWTQYVARANDGELAHAAHYRIERRHLESRKSFVARTVAAANCLHEASEAFIAEAERVGRLKRVGEAGLLWTLPAHHPLALALIEARYPNGPKGDDLKAVALGIVADRGVDFGVLFRRDAEERARHMMSN
jgi:hypothetical protein